MAKISTAITEGCQILRELQERGKAVIPLMRRTNKKTKSSRKEKGEQKKGRKRRDKKEKEVPSKK